MSSVGCESNRLSVVKARLASASSFCTAEVTLLLGAPALRWMGLMELGSSGRFEFGISRDSHVAAGWSYHELDWSPWTEGREYGTSL